MTHALAPAGLMLFLLTAPALAADPIRVDVQARRVQPGELVVLTLTVPENVSVVRVHAFDRDIPTFKVGEGLWRALVGIDVAVKAGRHTVTIDAGGPLRATHELRVLPHRFPSRRLTVDESFVNPPPAVQGRIVREAQELVALWRASAPERLWTGSFVRPVPEAANSAFGSRSIFNGQPRAPHGGADFTSPAGTPVHAPTAGRIVLARSLYFTGNTIVIDHGLGLFSLLAHLSRLDAPEGAAVIADEVVGLVGATGRVTGPHLHWAVRLNDARIDPLSILAVLGREP